MRRVGDLAAVGAVYHIPAGPHEDTAALQVLANILSTRPSGRLYKALVETKKAAGASAFAGREQWTKFQFTLAGQIAARLVVGA